MSAVDAAMSAAWEDLYEAEVDYRYLRAAVKNGIYDNKPAPEAIAEAQRRVIKARDKVSSAQYASEDLPPGKIITSVTSTLNPSTLEAYHHIEIYSADGSPEALSRETARSAARAILETVPGKEVEV